MHPVRFTAVIATALFLMSSAVDAQSVGVSLTTPAMNGNVDTRSTTSNGTKVLNPVKVAFLFDYQAFQTSYEPYTAKLYVVDDRTIPTPPANTSYPTVYDSSTTTISRSTGNANQRNSSVSYSGNFTVQYDDNSGVKAGKILFTYLDSSNRPVKDINGNP